MSKKIVTIIGARPQFIKAAAVSRAIGQTNLKEVLVHTGQHFDYGMSDVFFEEMEIPTPKYNLGINSLSHGAMTGRMIEEIEKVLMIEKPDFLMVFGDTNSTLAGALAAAKFHIPVAHVEAGLRSFNMRMPEEINRILTDRISNLLFCPTNTAVKNLQAEGYNNFDCKIINSGDVMFDAAMYYANKSESISRIVSTLNLNSHEFVLATLHRQENTDDLQRLQSIIEALNEINNKQQVVLPLHPRTRKIIEQAAIRINFTLIDPVGYFDMIELLKHCSLVMTDSGGLQKEAFFFQKNCVTLRDQTEWVELVENGYNILAGANKNEILKSFQLLSLIKNSFSEKFYGDGNAAIQITTAFNE
jgi:UDP-GlcNAc3NAcA epimerase